MRAHFLSLASFERDASTLEHVNSANVATGMRLLNAVRAAEPGFAATPSLSPVRSLIGFGN
jgi:hypothetical protein